MKLPSIHKIPKMPQMPKIPKLSGEELREKLPFQSRREFVMHDSEHPVDASAMEYRPSTGYVAPQAPVPPQPDPMHAYRNIDHELPFQQEMVYPGGGQRIPYAAGGQARPEYAGSWPPPPPAPAPKTRQPYTPPRREPVPPAFAQAEYYVPRQNYRPSEEFAQPRYYAEPPRPQQPHAPAQPYYPPQQPPRNSKPAQKKPQPGFGVRLAAIAGALLPKREKSPADARAQRPQPQYVQPGQSAPGYPPQQGMPPRPQRPAVGATELKYYIWSGSIVAGLVLTVVSFIYACAV